MNKEFKVGDVVVLVEEHCLSGLARISAKERHLFEVTGRSHGVILLRSLSTLKYTTTYEENVRHATLKEQFLRTGNVVKMKCGKTFIVINNSITNQYEREPNTIFNDDLTNKINEEFDIVEVYNFNSGNNIEALDRTLKVNEDNLHKLIWERKPKVELSSDEIIILKNVEKKYKYIARDNDKSGSLNVFEKEPIKGGMYHMSRKNEGWQYLSAFYHLFQDITFESGAHLIDELIKENEK